MSEMIGRRAAIRDLADAEKFNMSLVTALVGFGFVAINQLSLTGFPKLALVTATLSLLVTAVAHFTMISALKTMENHDILMEIGERQFPRFIKRAIALDGLGTIRQEALYVRASMVSAIFGILGGVALVIFVLNFALAKLFS